MTDDNLPPESILYADLLRWLTQRLGRRPTLVEMAEIRAAQREASRRRAGRAPRPTLGGQAPKDIVHDLFSGPEGAAMLSAIAALPMLLACLAQARPHDEWITRPETVRRLARAAATAAEHMPPRRQLEPSARRQLAALRAYLTWTLRIPVEGEAPARANLWPPQADDIHPDVVAVVNAGTPDAARALLTQAEDTPMSGAGPLLHRLRREGAQLRERYGNTLGWLTGEPLGLIQPPPPPVSDTEEEDWQTVAAATGLAPLTPGGLR